MYSAGQLPMLLVLVFRKNVIFMVVLPHEMT
jgi:hypothetical protein